MRELLVYAVLYLLALGFFRLLGGFAAAADTFRRWGRASATLGAQPRSSS